MRAPSMAPPLVKLMSMYFPNRLELSLRMVFAFPKAVGSKEYLIREADHRVCLTNCLVFTLQDGVCFQDLLLYPGVLAAHRSQELQHQLGALRLPCSRLSTGGKTQFKRPKPGKTSSNLLQVCGLTVLTISRMRVLVPLPSAGSGSVLTRVGALTRCSPSTSHQVLAPPLRRLYCTAFFQMSAFLCMQMRPFLLQVEPETHDSITMFPKRSSCFNPHQRNLITFCC